MPEILTTRVHARLLELVLAKGYTRRDEPFRLSSGALSHDYVDLRRAVADGPDLALAADAVVAALETLGPIDAIGGMTMGADPIAHAVALVSGRSWFSVRKAEKDHGAGRRSEGAELSSGTSVVVFEDTVSTGGSLLDALDVVESTGASVRACLTVLDRGELAAPQFARRSIPYLALLSYRDLGIEAIGAPVEAGEPAGS